MQTRANASSRSLKPVVEDHPCLTLADVKRAGPSAEAWAKLAGSPFAVKAGAGFLLVQHPLSARRRTVTRVALQKGAATFGKRAYFVCPLSGARVMKLYLAEGVLGCRKALGLDHLSHTRPGAHQRHQRQAAGRPKGAAGVSKDSPQPVSTQEGWERGQGLQLDERRLLDRLTPDLQAARHGEIRSTRSHAMNGWGWAWKQAQLDCQVLDRLGLIEPERRHAAAFSWEQGHGDVETVLLQTDLAGGRSPLAVLSLVCGSNVSRQAVALVQVKGRWRFRCPVNGEVERVLYARAGRFASREAQFLVLGDERPAAPFADAALVPDTWDEPWR